MNTVKPGDRVQTPHGPGTVVYQRMAPPDYTEPRAFSVVLDDLAEKPGYSGTIIAANVVLPFDSKAPTESWCRVCAADDRVTRLHLGACWMHGTQVRA